MIHSLKAEARKLTSVRSWWVLMAGTVAFPLVTVAALATDPEAEATDVGSETILSLMRTGADVTAVAALLLGILAMAGEYRHGTMVGSMLAQPRRARLIGAKLITLGGAGALLALASATTSVVIGGLYLRSIEVDVLSAPAADVIVVLAGIGSVAALYGAIGAGLGAVVRNQTAAVAGALIWILSVEGVLPLVLRNPGLRDWTVTGAAQRLYHLPDPVADSPSAWAAAGLLVAVAALIGLAGVVVTQRADVA